jgi:hypothetical protein
MRRSPKENYDVRPFTEYAIHRHSQGVSWAFMAQHGGWGRKNGMADGNAFKKRVGLALDKRRKPIQTVSYDTGVRLCKALNCDPVEVGL